MKTVNYCDIIVIGAGPAGLSLGYYMEKSGLDYMILEKDEIGFSWKSMPEKLVVLSPWWTNLLPGSWLGYTNPFSLVNKDFYYTYLKQYATKNNIKVKNNINVTVLKKINSNYIIETNVGSFGARFVISATGYYSNPYIPVLPKGNDGSIAEMHVGNYFSAKKIAKDYPHVKRVLLVGKRVSAGQVMIELANYGFELDIACRSELIMRQSHTLKGKVKEFIYYFYEAVKIRFKPFLKSNSFVDMDGGDTARLIDTGVVRKKDNILEISSGLVSFSTGEDGTAYDLVIYATGYRPAIQYFDSTLYKSDKKDIPEVENMESTESENLFFIGIDNLVNFRSRYLRGIAKDAKQLIKIIKFRIS